MLCAADEAPWWSLRGELLDGRGLTRLLKPYGARPATLREGKRTFKGYRRASFEDAWARYVPEEESKQAKHPSHPAHRAENGVSEGAFPAQDKG